VTRGARPSRLFRQIYAAVVGAVVLFAASVAAVRYFEPRRGPEAAASDELRHVLALHWLLGLLLFLAAAAVAAYPLARRLTGRLDRLRAEVRRFGEGNLDARVSVEGGDEVAELARGFNAAAERVQALVRAQRQLLANVSHELRTPLARLRMSVELLPGDAGSEPRRSMIADLHELDTLIGDLLVASRLESGAPLERVEDVDLLALAAEEAARSGAEVTGASVSVRGDPRLLRVLVRNLLENARVHGRASAVCAEVRADAAGACLRVRDAGPGVPEAERERIFEAFHRVPGRSQASGGSGLGLALVRQIARRHGGEARCLAQDGPGACFEVRLKGAAPPTT
jgi:signal transduction histidine kinase